MALHPHKFQMHIRKKLLHKLRKRNLLASIFKFVDCCANTTCIPKTYLEFLDETTKVVSIYDICWEACVPSTFPSDLWFLVGALETRIFVSSNFPSRLIFGSLWELWKLKSCCVINYLCSMVGPVHIPHFSSIDGRHLPFMQS